MFGLIDIRFFAVLIAITFIILFAQIRAEKTVSVTISNGIINGKTETILDGKQLNVFRGIPYAEPPVGQLRFRKPVPIKRWDEPLNAYNFSSACVQKGEMFKVEEYLVNPTFSEDCLYLNVWTPTDLKNSDVLKPVMFWIHGGGLLVGSASEEYYQGDVLAVKGDVVVVSFNYRVNTLGFFYTGTSEAPGNVGLWDQAMALEWVNDNIRYFGGDPEKITIFGESAGGWSVSSHIISPVSRNLFKNAIMNSGANLYNFNDDSPEDHIKKWLKGAEMIGCVDQQNRGKFTPKIMDCLREKDAKELSEVSDFPELMYGIVKVFTLIVVDGQFIPDKPIEMIRNGDFKQNVNLMISTVEDEGSFLLTWLTDPVKFHPISPQNFTYNEAFNELSKISSGLQSDKPINGKEVAKLYFTGLSDNNSFEQLIRVLGIAIGDYYLTCPTIEFAKEVFRHSKEKANVYQYYFNSKFHENFFCSKWMGVCHTNDIFPMFGIPFLDLHEYNDRERQISEQMIEFLTDFAKTGAPTPQNGAKWPKYWSINDNIITPYYEITNQLKSTTNFNIGLKFNECQYLWKKYII